MPLPVFVILSEGKFNHSMCQGASSVSMPWRPHVPKCTEHQGLQSPEPPLPAVHTSQHAVAWETTKTVGALALVHSLLAPQWLQLCPPEFGRFMLQS